MATNDDRTLDRLSLGLPVVCAAVTTLFTLRHTFKFLHHVFSHRRPGYELLSTSEDAQSQDSDIQLYSDEDGTATEESMATYSAMWQTSGILIGSLAGFAVGLTDAILAVVDGERVVTAEWVMVGVWACFLINTLILLFEHNCIRVFNHATLLFWLSSASNIAIAGRTITKSSHANRSLASDELGLLLGQLAASFTIFVSSVLVPRRPDVFNSDRKLVDRMRTVSLFSRYTLSWGNDILMRAYKKGYLDEIDIHAIDHRIRAHVLLDAFEAMTKSRSLWMTVIRAHWVNFLKVYLGSSLGILLNFTPAVIMSQLLRHMEEREMGADVTVMAGLWWVALLGAVKFLEGMVFSSIWWINFMGLAIPIRDQLAAAVFAKTLRKKDVKGSQKEDEKDDSKVGEEDEDELKNLKQGTINLLSVDAERIAIFTAMSNISAESLVGTIYGYTYIWILLGWQAFLAGVLVAVLTTPMNVYFSKKYSEAQDELMNVRDKKMAVISETLHGIRQIKFSAQEDRWEQKIREVREEELQTLKRVFICDVWVISAWIINPVFLSAASLSIYAIINGTLTASVAFPALTIFGNLEWTLSIVPEVVTDGFDALVSLKRIERYLNSAEQSPTQRTSSSRIAFTNATIAWASEKPPSTSKSASSTPSNSQFTLQDLNLEFPRNELSIISGRTGSGKSLLLSSLLGEADLLSGTISFPTSPPPSSRFDAAATPGSSWILPDAVAYVAQIPWIENGSLRDNILFGLPYHESRYKATLHACALEKDMDALPDGELTEIGVNGINLSGGQRWRVSLARAVYSRAGILVLDDVFSAVDAHVGRHIFEHGLMGELMNNRTRILVTHHIRFCVGGAGYAVVLGDGGVLQKGRVDELQEKGVLESIIKTVEEEDGDVEAEDVVLDGEEMPEITKVRTRDSVGAGSRSRRGSRAPEVADRLVDLAPKDQGAPVKFVEDETREYGAVSREVYRKYISASGGWSVWLFLLFLFTVQEGLIVGRNFWIKMWTSESVVESSPSVNVSGLKVQSLLAHSISQLKAVASADENHSLLYWIGVYTGLCLVTVLLGTWRYWYLFLRSLIASRKMFDDLVHVVMRAPLRWLDTVPTGRILNRFSKDFETIDSKLIQDIAYLLWNVLGLLGINLAAFYLSPYVLVLTFISFFGCLQYANYYLSAARELKRMESNSRSPIFELFGATLSGVATIRAFTRTDDYISKMFARIDTYGQRTFYVWLFNRWIGLRLAMVGALFAVLVGFVIVLTPRIDASMAGFALSFALNYSGNVIWTLRRYANMELDMNSAERILEYSNLPTEDAGGVHPPPSWPHSGHIEVRDLVVSYAPDLPPVLKGISFTVLPRQRIGIVGRTGAGKSSLTLALFQFICATSGTITIDGLDISTLNLHDLRSRIAIIPQDPVLFSGTVRSNLDPFSLHPDSTLLDALRRVHLIPTASPTSRPSTASSLTQTPNTSLSLTTSISESGLNLSQGQRQLLCLARAIIERPKILVLDEATSAVDMETDVLIQESIRSEFGEATALVIAHRLQTVVEFDRILVLGEGEVREWGAPEELVGREGGVFSGMVEGTGEGEKLLERIRVAGEGRRQDAGSE